MADSPAGREGPYRVLLVDDSQAVRRIVRRLVERCDTARVVAEAGDGAEAARIIAERARGGEPVEVVFLDIEMPGTDGLAALERMRSVQPMPKVIMLSALTRRGATVTLRALARGAADYICKPSAGSGPAFEAELRDKLQLWGAAFRRERARAAAARRARRDGMPEGAPPRVPASRTPAAAPPSPSGELGALAIGASTGGPQAVMQLLAGLRGAMGFPVFLVQHMPPGFTRAFAEQIAHTLGVEAVEAEEGMPARSGRVHVAPGDHHLRAVREAGEVRLRLDRSPPLHFCRPAVDALLDSLAPLYGRHLWAVILTGMGQDGVEGCRRVVEQGGTVLAQDEESSVVWGMPGAVVRARLARFVGTPEMLARRLREARRMAA